MLLLQHCFQRNSCVFWHGNQVIFEYVMRIQPFLDSFYYIVQFSFRFFADSQSSIVPDLHLLRIVDEQMVDGNSYRHYLALDEKIVSCFFNNHQLFMPLRVYLKIVKVLFFHPWMLLKCNKVRIGISCFLKILRKHIGIGFFHPMLTLLVHLAIFSTKASIPLFQSIHLSDIFSCQNVPIISVISSSYLYRKCNIPHIKELNPIWMTRHHGCPGQPISKHRPQMINPVSTCRVTCDKHFIWIYNVLKHKTFDDDLKEFWQIALPPHIRCFFARSRHEPNASFGQKFVVKTEMIIELLIIDWSRAASSSMETKNQGVASLRFISFGKVLKIHCFVVQGDCLFIYHHVVELSELYLFFSPLCQSRSVFQHKSINNYRNYIGQLIFFQYRSNKFYAQIRAFSNRISILILYFEVKQPNKSRLVGHSSQRLLLVNHGSQSLVHLKQFVQHANQLVLLFIGQLHCFLNRLKQIFLSIVSIIVLSVFIFALRFFCTFKSFHQSGSFSQDTWYLGQILRQTRLDFQQLLDFSFLLLFVAHGF